MINNEKDKEQEKPVTTVCLEIAGAESVDFIDVQPTTVQSK